LQDVNWIEKTQVGHAIYLVQALYHGTAKKACVALSTAEVEYIDAGSYRAQILQIKQQLEDFLVESQQSSFIL